MNSVFQSLVDAFASKLYNKIVWEKGVTPNPNGISSLGIRKLEMY